MMTVRWEKAGAVKGAEPGAVVGLVVLGVLVMSASMTGARVVPLGPPVQVTTGLTARENSPRVAVLPDGGFVVVWDRAGSEPNLLPAAGQRFDSSGNAVDSEFALQGGATVAATDGTLIVDWDGLILGRFTITGTPIGAPIHILMPDDGLFDSTVVAGANGGFVTAWSGDDGQDLFVRFQRFDASNEPMGPLTSVASYEGGKGFPFATSMSRRADESLVVSWLEAFSQAIWAQVFDAQDMPLGDAAIVAEVVPDNASPTLCADSTGDFVVSWYDERILSVQFRRYDLRGQAATPVLNSGLQKRQSVACLPERIFVLAGLDAGSGVIGRAFDVENRSLGKFALPSSGVVMAPAIAALPDNRVVVAWSQCSSRRTALACDIFIERLAVQPGTDCAGDCDGDGAVTIDEIIGTIYLVLYDNPEHACLGTANCSAIDTDLDCQVSITEIIAAVDRALEGCE